MSYFIWLTVQNPKRFYFQIWQKAADVHLWEADPRECLVFDQSLDRTLICNYFNNWGRVLVISTAKKCQTFADSSCSNRGICCFPWSYMVVNWILLSLWPNKQFKDITLGSGKLHLAFFTILWYCIDKTINRLIYNENNWVAALKPVNQHTSIHSLPFAVSLSHFVSHQVVFFLWFPLFLAVCLSFSFPLFLSRCASLGHNTGRLSTGAHWQEDTGSLNSPCQCTIWSILPLLAINLSAHESKIKIELLPNSLIKTKQFGYRVTSAFYE